MARIGERRINGDRRATDKALNDIATDLVELETLRATVRAQARLLRHYQHALGLRLDPPFGWRERLEEV
jgi:hypothetical protein